MYAKIISGIEVTTPPNVNYRNVKKVIKYLEIFSVSEVLEGISHKVSVRPEDHSHSKAKVNGAEDSEGRRVA
jgi:hypothetical protein